jgi:hypothetical protein
MQGNFSKGNPQPNESVASLLDRDIRLRYGTLPDGTTLEARVIFSPHITGDAAAFAAARAKVLAQLISAAQGGFLRLNPASGHLQRPRGSCLFCPMLEIGKCDYEQELQPVSLQGALMSATATSASVMKEKAVHMDLLEQMPSPAAEPVWQTTDDIDPNLR